MKSGAVKQTIRRGLLEDPAGLRLPGETGPIRNAYARRDVVEDGELLKPIIVDVRRIADNAAQLVIENRPDLGSRHLLEGPIAAVPKQAIVGHATQVHA